MRTFSSDTNPTARTLAGRTPASPQAVEIMNTITKSLRRLGGYMGSARIRISIRFGGLDCGYLRVYTTNRAAGYEGWYNCMDSSVRITQLH